MTIISEAGGDEDVEPTWCVRAVAGDVHLHGYEEVALQGRPDTGGNLIGAVISVSGSTDLQIRHAYTHPSRITPVGSTESVPCGIDRHDYTGTVQQFDLDRSFLRLMLPYLPQLIAMPFVPLAR